MIWTTNKIFSRKAKLVLISFLILLPLVSSEIITTGQIKYDTSEPYMVTYEVQKGWNLLGSIPSDTFYNTCGDSIRAQWSYVNSENNWFGFYRYQNFGSYLYSDNFQNIMNKSQEDERNNYYYANFRSYFLYADKQCEFKTYVDNLRDISDTDLEQRGMKFTQGWNFVLFIPQMVGKSWDNVFGECDITKAHNWEPYNQTWELNGMPQRGTLEFTKTIIPASAVGQVILMDFDKQCTLKLKSTETTPTIPQPPQIPN